MKLTKKCLFQISMGLKSDSQLSNPGIYTVLSTVSKTLNIPASDTLKSAVKVQLNAFKRLSQSKRPTSLSDKIDSIEHEVVFDSETSSNTTGSSRESLSTAEDAPVIL